jgi:hypothetical protein
MVHVGDGAQVDACFGLFGDRANLDARYVHGLRQKYRRPQNGFGQTRQNTSMTWVMWNHILVRLETLLVSVQGRCMVCTKRNISSEIILDAPDVTPR